MSLSVLSSLPNQQTVPQSPVTFYVESWRKGSQQILEQKLTIEITSERRNYNTVVRDSNGNERLLLSIDHQPLSNKATLPFEWWQVNLYEKVISDGTHSQFGRKNLLQIDEPGTSDGDTLPVENSIASIFPLKDSMFIGIGKGTAFYPSREKPLVGVTGYSITATRVIKVMSFYCVINVTNFKLNEANPHVPDSLTVNISLANNYKLRQ